MYVRFSFRNVIFFYIICVQQVNDDFFFGALEYLIWLLGCKCAVISDEPCHRTLFVLLSDVITIYMVTYRGHENTTWYRYLWIIVEKHKLQLRICSYRANVGFWFKWNYGSLRNNSNQYTSFYMTFKQYALMINSRLHAI